jgi:HKD family nuclease
MLRKLQKNNPNATIIILMDFRQYTKLRKDEFTEVTGREYVLLPIDSRHVFHSKIFMFISDQKKQTILGSHNLTFSGLVQNLELCFSSDDDDLFKNCISYVYSVLEKNLDSKDSLLKKIKPYDSSKTKNQKLLTNENEGILDQCLKSVSKQLSSIKEVIIFSPFFSKDLKPILEKIMEIDPTGIKLCIQKDNHNLDPTTTTSFDKLSLNEITSENTEQSTRRLHSKFIMFRGSDKDLILIGSPNFSSPALLKTSKDGNFESAILFELDSDSLIKNHLKINSITENEVIDSKREVINSTNSQIIPDIVIILAHFDDLGTLHVNYKSKIKKSVKLEFLKHEEKIDTKEIELKEGLHHEQFYSIPKEINEICFSENDQIISNQIRVCHQKALNVRGSIDLTDPSLVEKILFGDENLDEFFSFRCLFDSATDEQIGYTRKKENSSQDISFPGKKKASKSNSGLLDLILKIPHLKTKDDSTPGQKNVQKQPASPERDETVKNFMKKLCAWFEDFIIKSTHIPMRYELFLLYTLSFVSKLFESKNDKVIVYAQIIRQLNEIIGKDKSFSELPNISRNKIFVLLEIITILYHKNYEKPYLFDLAVAKILCAFKPMINPNSETYSIEENDGKSVFVDIEKLIQKEKIKDPQWDKFKISDDTQFSGDEKEISKYRDKFMTRFVSNSI